MTQKVVFPSFRQEMFSAAEMRQLVSALEIRFQSLEQDDYGLYSYDTNELDLRYAQIGHTHVSSEITDLNTSIFGLDDVTGTPSIGEGLIWNGTAFETTPISGGGASNLNDLTDVNAFPTDGQALVWDVTTLRWIAADPPSGGVDTLVDLTDTDLAGQLQGDLMFNADGTEWQSTGTKFQWVPDQYVQLGYQIGINWYSAAFSSVELLTFSGGISGDVYWNSVGLYTRLNGTDGSTSSFNSDDDNAHILVPTNGAQIDTAQSKFGGSSILLDNTGAPALADYVRLNDYVGMELLGNDFTVEAWIRLASLPTTSVDGGFTIIAHYQNSGNLRQWWFKLDDSNALEFAYSTDGITVDNVCQTAFSFAVDTWYAVAAVRDGNSVYLYVDGTRIGTHAVSGSVYNQYSAFPYIGLTNTSSGSRSQFDGWIDEIRLTVGVARYTGATYTLQTDEFPTVLGATEAFTVGDPAYTTTIDGTTTTVTGNAVVDGTLSVAGATDLGSTLNVVGAADLDSTLNVDGAADFRAGVTIHDYDIYPAGTHLTLAYTGQNEDARFIRFVEEIENAGGAGFYIDYEGLSNSPGNELHFGSDKPSSAGTIFWIGERGQLRLEDNLDIGLTLSSTDHPLQIGPSTSDNLRFDRQGIQYLVNGTPNTLRLNEYGGGVYLNSVGYTTTASDLRAYLGPSGRFYRYGDSSNLNVFDFFSVNNYQSWAGSTTERYQLVNWDGVDIMGGNFRIGDSLSMGAYYDFSITSFTGPAVLNFDSCETWSITGLTTEMFVDTDLRVSGDLTVGGTTTTINSNTVAIADNIILLNSDAVDPPTENAGLEIERGGVASNVSLRWNESLDDWEITYDGATFYGILTDNDVPFIADGTAINNTLQWNGSVWAENANLKVPSSGNISMLNGLIIEDSSYALELQGGRGAAQFDPGYQIAFGFNSTSNYRHSITTRHNSGATTGNAIDFNLWEFGVDAAGDYGTNRVMEIENASINMLTDLDVTGNIVVSGNVDGVDVSAHAADGTIHFTQGAISIPLSQINDVTATAAEVNLLDLATLTAGWVLSADTATTASWKQLSHTLLGDIGTNSHAQIDTHLADTSIHFTQASISIPLSQINDVTATAAEVNLLDLSALTVGWVLRATGAATAAWSQLAHGDLSDVGTNTHAQIDTHIGDSTIHFTQGAISIPLSQISDVTATAAEVNLLDLAALTAGWALTADTATTASWKQIAHSTLSGIGTNTHAQIDTHIADTSIHFTKSSILLDDLSDVTETTITAGDVLRWNGAEWVNYADSNYASSSHTHLLAAGATDVTATAAEVNLLDLAGLTVGWGLVADSATTASWQALPSGATNLTWTASTRTVASDTGTDAVLTLVTATEAGLAPLSGGGTTNYLRADGTWAAPPGGSSSNSFETHTVTDTDSGFTWAETGSAVADSATDTLTWVSGAGIDIDVDAASDAIRIAATNAGTIGGSITDNQIAVGAATANDIEGSALLTWDASTLLVDGSVTVYGDATSEGVMSHSGGTTPNRVFTFDMSNTDYVDFTNIVSPGGVRIRDGAQLEIYDSTDTNYLFIKHTGTDVSWTGVNTDDFTVDGLTWFKLLAGGGLAIYDSTNNDEVNFSHDGTYFNINAVNTDAVRLQESLWIYGAGPNQLRIYDASGLDYAQFNHDGADFNTTFANTTDWNISGATNVRYGISTGIAQGKAGSIRRMTMSNSSTITTTWYKICEVSIPSGVFQAQGFWIEAIKHAGNHGQAAPSADVHRYAAEYARSGAVEGDDDTGRVIGNGNLIRMVRTALGEYELQFKPDADNMAYTLEIHADTGGEVAQEGWITWFDIDSKVAGATIGTIYTATGDSTLYENRLLGTVRISGGSLGANYADFSHDGTDFSTAFTNTTDWDIEGIAAIKLGQLAKVDLELWEEGQVNLYNIGATSGASLYMTGADLQIAGIATTNIDITGFTSIQAGTVDADFDAITATSYGGITEANLVDKTSAETISGGWTFTNVNGPIIETAQPELMIRETDAPADEGNWVFRANQGIFRFQTASDATPSTSASEFITFNRVGTAVNTISLVGVTTLSAGSTDADFDAITATSYGGITEANLVDKTATESITGSWNFDTDSGVVPLNISRSGNSTQETLQVSIADRTADFRYIEDTSNEGVGNFGDYRFILTGNSAEGDTVVMNLSHELVTIGSGIDLTVGGDLTVSGTTTTINSNTVSIADNLILLNSDEAGAPTQDAGLEIERGTSANVFLQFDETSDRWEFTNDGSTYYNIPISTEQVPVGTTTDATLRWSGSTWLENTSILASAGGLLTMTTGGAPTIDFTNTGGPIGIRWSAGKATSAQVDLVYRTTPEVLYIERVSDGADIAAFDPSDLSTTLSSLSSGAGTFTGTLTAAGGLSLNDGAGGAAITNVGSLAFNDPGPGEGITWTGGNFSIYESPNDLVTNTAGNLQFVSGGVRRATIDTGGGLYVQNNINASQLVTLTHTAPGYRWSETGAPTTEGNWWMVADGGGISLRAYDDAFSAYDLVMQVNRTGINVDEVNFYVDGSTERLSVDSTGVVVTGNMSASGNVIGVQGDFSGNVDSDGSFTGSGFVADAVAGNGLSLWGGSKPYPYGIWMSTGGDATYGGRVSGETTSDYNMYFNMEGGTNRGYVFQDADAPYFSINPDGVRSEVGYTVVAGDIVGAEADTLIRDVIADQSTEGDGFYNPLTYNAFAGADKWATITVTNAYASDRTTPANTVTAGPFSMPMSPWQPYFNVGETEITVEIDHTAEPLRYHAIVGVQWTNSGWKAERVKIEAFNGTIWTTGVDTTTNGATTVAAKFSLSSAGIQKTKFTFGNPTNSAGGYMRICQFFGYDYNGISSWDAEKSGLYYVDRLRDSAHYSNIYPAVDSDVALGQSGKRYTNVYSDALDVAGNITVTGTVDSVDIAALEAAAAKTADNETITGNWTFQTDGSSDFVIQRQGSGVSDASVIRYENLDGLKGYAGFSDDAKFSAYDGSTNITFQVDASGVMVVEGYYEAKGLGPLTTPGTDDLYVGGYGIMGDRTSPVYVSNVSGPVSLQYGGVHGAAATEFSTQDSLATGQTSGAEVRAHNQTFRDVGFNVLPDNSSDASFSLTAVNCGHCSLKTNSTARTVTLYAATNLDFPVGGVFTYMNAFTSGNVTINASTNTATLYWLDGSTRTGGASTNRTLGPGGVATIRRHSSTIYYIWGSGIS